MLPSIDVAADTSPRCLPRKSIASLLLAGTLTATVRCKSFHIEDSLRRLKEKTAPSNAQTSMHRNTQRRKNKTLPRKTKLFSNWTPKEWRPMSYLKKSSKLLCWGSPVKFKRTQTTQWTQKNNAWTKSEVQQRNHTHTKIWLQEYNA